MAAIWAHYTLETFEALPRLRQALIVAAYRVQHQIEAVLMEDSKVKAGQAQAMQEAIKLAGAK